MTRKELITAEIGVWEDSVAVYTSALAESIKYGDYG